MTVSHGKFKVGELVHHKLFGYRGVCVDVDPTFQGTDEWYATVARSRPPRDRPWYHVLPHATDHMTYVAERNLEPDDSAEPIDNQAVPTFFERFEDGGYIARRKAN